MGHADIQTTMRYLHHVPKHDAAARFTDFIRQELSPKVSRTAESSEQLSASPATK
jgi:hypothetical protein